MVQIQQPKSSNMADIQVLAPIVYTKEVFDEAVADSL